MPPSSRSPQTGEMTLKLLANRLVSAIPGNIRQTLALNPEDALTGLLGISVAPVRQLRDSRGAGGWCDGLSFTTDRIICYAPSPGSRRQNFTLMHEYGHLRISENDEALDWLADRQDPSGDLERLCDAIAAEILASRTDNHPGTCWMRSGARAPAAALRRQPRQRRSMRYRPCGAPFNPRSRRAHTPANRNRRLRCQQRLAASAYPAWPRHTTLPSTARPGHPAAMERLDNPGPAPRAHADYRQPRPASTSSNASPESTGRGRSPANHSNPAGRDEVWPGH